MSSLPPVLLNTADVCERLQIHRSTLWTLEKRGGFLGGGIGISVGAGGTPFDAITLRGERVALTGQPLTLKKAS